MKIKSGQFMEISDGRVIWIISEKPLSPAGSLVCMGADGKGLWRLEGNYTAAFWDDNMLRACAWEGFSYHIDVADGKILTSVFTK